MSVDPAGRVAAAWVESRARSTAVRAATAAAGGRYSVHTLLATSTRPVEGLGVVLGRRGDITVVWVDQTGRRTVQDRRVTLRAAYRTAGGTWSGPRVIAHPSSLFSADPRLAARPDGAVLLTFNATMRSGSGVAAAWRAPGRAFGEVQRVATPGRAGLTEPALAFGADRRAYLTGVTGCDGSARSAGVLLATGPGQRRFDAPQTIAPAPVSHLRFVVTGTNAGAAVWLHAGCRAGVDGTGAVGGAVMRAGRIQPAFVVDARSAIGATLAGAPGGAADATVAETPAEGAGRLTMVVARISPEGRATVPQSPADGWSALVADHRGDQVVTQIAPAAGGTPIPIAARPAEGAVVERAPFDAPVVTAAAPFGAMLAIGQATPDALRVSAWRPAAQPVSVLYR